MNLICWLLTHKWNKIGPETVVCNRCGWFVREARIFTASDRALNETGEQGK